ncbi:MAG: hypothetical protein HON90_07545 [Halobacteriovoraceae bacterium]|jgi:hypothetical protein|nr:hypothetical protein [Halobacteriovoraceae bacterium]
MFKYLFILGFSLNSYAELSFGDGTETCDWTTSDKSLRSYHCDFVNIPFGETITFNAATDYIIIRSQGDVNIAGNINISANGNTAGPGGSQGGVCPNAVTCDAVDGAVKEGGQGLGGGAGSGNDGGGGGGSGARFGDTLPTAGTSGNTSAGNAGIGGTIPTTGYFLESNFESNFGAGAGGGAGGSGIDGFTDINDGGVAGAGGGGIIIIAKGSVSIAGNILANGGNGVSGGNSVGQDGGGGGGAGSGGAIYIIGASGVTITGTISANGGTGGASGSGGTVIVDGGVGGDGGSGRIRIDSLTGAYSGIATISPIPYQATLPTIVDPLLSSSPISNPEFSSDIEYSCAYKPIDTSFNLGNFILSFILGVVCLGIPKVLHRLRYG